jgi:hypothetical protein
VLAWWRLDIPADLWRSLRERGLLDEAVPLP